MSLLRRFGIYTLLPLCVSFVGCINSALLSTPWSENFALATYGSEANHPALNDGKLETVAMVPARNERIFMLKFPSVKPIRKIVIHNGNLFWFDVDYWDTEALEWKTIRSIRERRDIGKNRVQSEYVIDRLNLRTNMLRINVSRTVDDDVIAKPIREPGDKVLDRSLTIDGVYMPHYRVVKPSWAEIREIEVYHLAAN